MTAATVALRGIAKEVCVCVPRPTKRYELLSYAAMLNLRHRETVSRCAVQKLICVNLVELLPASDYFCHGDATGASAH